jgi:hypothetical protein
MTHKTLELGQRDSKNIHTPSNAAQPIRSPSVDVNAVTNASRHGLNFVNIVDENAAFENPDLRVGIRETFNHRV